MLNDIQNELVKKVHQQLGEHFDAFVVLVQVDTPEGNEHVESSHGGGYYNALGMLEAAREHFISGHTGPVEEL